MPISRPSINEIRKHIQREHGCTKRHAEDLAQRVFDEPARSLKLLPFTWHAALHPKYVIAPELRRSTGISDPTGNTAVRNVMKKKNGLGSQVAKQFSETVQPAL